MKRALSFLPMVLSLLSSLGMADDRPNIILMLADDQGWSGLSVAMHPTFAGSKGDIFQTPNLERFASQGMRFSSAYAPASVCSPTRISLQTGKSPAALHWTKAAPPVQGQKFIEPQLIKNISANEVTIGEILRNAGYATAHYGKWHIAGGGPGNHGYDEHDGDTGNENAFQFKDPNPVDIFGMAERAANFMERSKKANKPFFIQLSWNALHAAENANEATKAKYASVTAGNNSKASSVAAITEDLDTGVGKLLTSVQKLGLAQNTYVIYMSDNGSGGGKRTGLNGGKGSVWEGGIRVPFIIRGPGIEANSWCDTPIVGYDLYPTFCAWADINPTALPPGLEGGSILPLLSNPKQGVVQRARPELVFHFPHYQSDDGPHSAIRMGNLKLIYFYEKNSSSLFDLSKDIGERTDLAAKMPKETQELQQRLVQYLKDVDAQQPTPNQNFDSSQPTQARKGRGAQEKTNRGMKKK